MPTYRMFERFCIIENNIAIMIFVGNGDNRSRLVSILAQYGMVYNQLDRNHLLFLIDNDTIKDIYHLVKIIETSVNEANELD